jgi:hypothetical protein
MRVNKWLNEIILQKIMVMVGMIVLSVNHIMMQDNKLRHTVKMGFVCVSSHVVF